MGLQVRCRCCSGPRRRVDRLPPSLHTVLRVEEADHAVEDRREEGWSEVGFVEERRTLGGLV